MCSIHTRECNIIRILTQATAWWTLRTGRQSGDQSRRTGIARSHLCEVLESPSDSDRKQEGGVQGRAGGRDAPRGRVSASQGEESPGVGAGDGGDTGLEATEP